MTRLRGARVISVLGVLAFWVGVFVAGALVDRYSAREDYISSLASRGSPVAVLVIGALLANAVLIWPLQARSWPGGPHGCAPRSSPRPGRP